MALLALWNPNIQFLKTDGTINAGGKLVVTDHNDAESIPANYSDADGTTLNPSPIVLDALGRATCYIDDASTYDLYVKDANGATLWTVSEMTPGAETIVVRAGFSVSSSDSSVAVTISVDADGVTNYDLSIQDEIDRAKTAEKAAKTEIVAGDNITVTKTVGADGQDVYTIDGEDGGVEGVYGVYTRVGNAWSKYSGDADITSLAEGNYHYTLFIGYSVSTPSNVIAEIESNAGTQTHRAQVDCSYAHDGWVEFSGDFYGTVLNPTLVFPAGVSLYPAAILFMHSTAQNALGSIKDWATSITAFRTGDVIPVDGPSGTAKMSKDDLLAVTAQNALAGNVAPAFDPTRTSDNQYLAGDAVSYNGKKYIFKTNHYGAWSSSDVYRVSESLFSVESSYKILPNTYYYDSVSVSTFTTDYDMLAYVRVKTGDVLTINVGAPGCYMRVYTKTGGYFDYFSFSSVAERTVQIKAPYDNKVPHYAMIPISKTARSSAFVKINGNLVFDGNSNEMLKLVATDIQGGQFQNIYFEGNDTAFTSNRFYNKLVAGHRYRAYLLCSDFTASGSDPTDYKLVLRPLYSDGTYGSALFICRVNDAASPYYDFVMPDNSYGVLFGGRAAKGKLVAMNLVDLSIPEYINPLSLSSKVTLSKTLINSSVSGGYPDHNDSTTRVCCTDIVLFPKSGKTTYKLTAPSGIQFSASVFNGAQNVQTGYVIGWKSDGAVFSFDTDSTKCYAFRPSFRRYDNSEITAAEVLQFIEEGKLYIEIVGENDLDYSTTQNFNAVSSARKKLITSSPWCKELATIAHISDIHGDVTRLRNARKIADLFGVDALVNSGDSVMYSGAARADFLKEYSSETIPLIFCIGNHEAFPNGSATQASLIADYITPLAVQNGYRKNSTDVADSAYYFRDLSGKKIRLVALNYYNNGVYNGSLGQSQLDWFVQTLASTPQDYGVIVVVHSPEDKIICPENLQTFYQKERVVSYQENGFYIGNRPVMQIIDAFISKTSGVETYTSEVDGEVSVAYDFTSLNSGVEFICYMTGHRHEDCVGYYSNATNKQLSLGITTGCALNSMYNNTAWNNQSDLGKNGGSGPSQDAVNIYAIDRDAGTIRIVRIGANITTSLEERNALTIPYRD